MTLGTFKAAGRHKILKLCAMVDLRYLSLF